MYAPEARNAAQLFRFTPPVGTSGILGNGQLYREMHAEQGITALTFGNALAALKRGIAGDIAIITPDEVRAVLQNRERNMRFR